MSEYPKNEVRRAVSQDADEIWRIIGPTIRAGETYTLPRDLAREEALAYWMAPERDTFIAEAEGRALGTYYMRPNQYGGGAHVANCGFMTSAEAAGRGVARAMCVHSLEYARSRGFRAMQFNFVVSTNERALHLWLSMGFDIVGTLPEAFDHPSRGYVDAFVMYRKL